MAAREPSEAQKAQADRLRRAIGAKQRRITPAEFSEREAAEAAKVADAAKAAPLKQQRQKPKR